MVWRVWNPSETERDGKKAQRWEGRELRSHLELVQSSRQLGGASLEAILRGGMKGPDTEECVSGGAL
jgi:hypothetical protein